MFAFVEFSVKFHNSVIKWVGQNPFDFIKIKFMAGFIENFVLVEKFADVHIPVAAGSKKMKSFLHKRNSLFINFYFLVNV